MGTDGLPDATPEEQMACDLRAEDVAIIYEYPCYNQLCHLIIRYKIPVCNKQLIKLNI